jgi:uncharacterized protein
VDDQLRTLIELQALDSRIQGLEAEAARLPREIEAGRAVVDEARKAVEAAKSQLDAARKEVRTRERDLEDIQAKRQKYEAQLYQVKTNKEYSAILAEIEEVKQQKARIEEDILTSMERQERLQVEIKEIEGRLRAAEAKCATEETQFRAKLADVEGELALVRSDRAGVARGLPVGPLADYDRLLRARGGLAVVHVLKPNLCGGCRMTVTPQHLQLLRQQALLVTCEACGRYLYWAI